MIENNQRITSFPHKHLIAIDDLSPDDVNTILDRADYFAKTSSGEKACEQTLKNKIILALFFEDSTRTCTSFEIAAKRLGADIIKLDLKKSSLNKGCLLYTSPSPRDMRQSRMPSYA